MTACVQRVCVCVCMRQSVGVCLPLCTHAISVYIKKVDQLLLLVIG